MILYHSLTVYHYIRILPLVAKPTTCSSSPGNCEEQPHSHWFLMLASIVPMSFCMPCSCPLPSEAPCFFSLKDMNKLSLLRGICRAPRERSGPEPPEPWRVTSCSREGRSLPTPHASAPAVAQGLPASRSSLRGSRHLGVPSDKGLRLRWESDFVLLESKKSACKTFFTDKSGLKYTCCNSYKHYDRRVGAARWIGHAERPLESVGDELEG